MSVDEREQNPIQIVDAKSIDDDDDDVGNARRLNFNFVRGVFA